MRIDIHANSFPLTDAIRQYAESQVLSAIKPVERLVQSVLVRLEDTNGDHGGVDKECRIVLSLRSKNDVMVKAVDADLYAAISSSARRVRRVALRAAKRRIGRERSDPQRPAVFDA